jgi:hypothetical protein
MKISQDKRDHAANLGVVMEAIQKGMEIVKQSVEICNKARLLKSSHA